VLERALYQSEKLHELSERAAGALRVIRSRSDAEALLTARADGQTVTGGILSFEGAQVLEGEVANVQRLYDAGYRVMGLLHFFDNALGGSLHGVAKEGLTPFGRQAVREMARLGIIIDLAHASEAVVRDVLAMKNVKRLIISHTGVKGACDTPRNIPDALMKQVAARGGLIGIGFWDAAVCDISPAGIVKSIRYAINLVGVDHVALGSDFDGATTTAFDVSELAVLTHEMLKAGFSEIEIRLVMGGNLAGFFLQHLPG
jgi:microsomal dipeptidase-like Zn-dependent dipeptidase